MLSFLPFQQSTPDLLLWGSMLSCYPSDRWFESGPYWHEAEQVLRGRELYKLAEEMSWTEFVHDCWVTFELLE